MHWVTFYGWERLECCKLPSNAKKQWKWHKKFAAADLYFALPLLAFSPSLSCFKDYYLSVASAGVSGCCIAAAVAATFASHFRQTFPASWSSRARQGQRQRERQRQFMRRLSLCLFSLSLGECGTQLPVLNTKDTARTSLAHLSCTPHLHTSIPTHLFSLLFSLTLIFPFALFSSFY